MIRNKWRIVLVDMSEASVEMHAGHIKANELSECVPELARLYQSIGMRCYFDTRYLEWGIEPHDGYNPHKQYPANIEKRKDEIDDILWNLMSNELGDTPDSSSFKQGALELAQQYINTPWLHTRWLTSRILTQVLDSEIRPLTRECTSAVVPNRITSLLPEPWGRIVPALVSLAFFVLLASTAWWALGKGNLVLSGLTVVYILWHYGYRFVTGFLRFRLRTKLNQRRVKYELVREEISTGNYDAAEIVIRLRRWESEGLWVHSLTYALLRIHS